MTNPEPAITSEPTRPSACDRWQPTLSRSLLSCVAGCALGSIVVHFIHPYFAYADLPELGVGPSPELILKHNVAKIAYYSTNYSLDFGLLGLFLGASVGLISTTRRQVISSLTGGLAGLLTGVMAGYFVGIYVAKAVIQSDNQSLVQSTLLHFAAWAPVVSGILLVIGLIQDQPRRLVNNLIVGIMVGLVAAVACNIVTSMVFPGENLLRLIPESSPARLIWMRVVWVATAGSVLGLGLNLGLRRQDSTSQ